MLRLVNRYEYIFCIDFISVFRILFLKLGKAFTHNFIFLSVVGVRSCLNVSIIERNAPFSSLQHAAQFCIGHEIKRSIVLLKVNLFSMAHCVM